MSFGLLRPDGQLGFIVSNAFAQRDLGQPLVEKFFPTVDLQKAVDCSGLTFPGHGTPTCIVFGAQRPPEEQRPMRVTGILSGGGDLRTPPEESALWYTIAAQHDNPGFDDARIIVADRPRKEMQKWPWSLVGRKAAVPEGVSTNRLEDFCAEPIGAQFITGKDEAYVLSGHCLRRLNIAGKFSRAYATGEDVRDWSVLPDDYVLFPYEKDLAPLSEPLPGPLAGHLKPFREVLENCVISGSIKKKETRLRWFEFRRLARAKFELPFNILNPHIATHCHFLLCGHEIAFKEKALAIALRPEFDEQGMLLLSGWLNSALLLEILKRDCFSKRESEDAARDTYFEFAGEKLRNLSVPPWLDTGLGGRGDALTQRLTALSRACWERGRELPSLALRKFFEKPGEAYHAWNAALPGHVPPHAKLGTPYSSTAEMQKRLAVAVSTRDQLRSEMIALQEEMDWLVYAAYGLVPQDAPCLGNLKSAIADLKLAEGERPFRLWAKANGDFDKARSLIPTGKDWPEARRALWEARLQSIRDNEHIRRIEQPVYKRRWDEQWKVSNRWMAGPVAYAQEFVDAFRWWLAEKAEWHLEHKATGGPLQLGPWTVALWKDQRIQAAWPVVADCVHRVDRWKCDTAEKKEGRRPPKLDASYEAFAKFLKETVADESVPAGIPPAVPWDDLAAKKKWTNAQLKKAQAVRGKLNVPRERFRQTESGEFVWAGRRD
jgi:hypothetical protein